MLDDLRRQIDIIDRNIVELFEKRLKIVVEIADIKKKKSISIYDCNREKSVIENVQKNVSEFSKPYVCMLYEKVLEISKKCQEDV